MTHWRIVLVLSAGLALLASADARAGAMRLLPHAEPERVFGGRAHELSTRWLNRGDSLIRAEVRTRLFQASSATAAPVAEASWKMLQLLPDQTVLESAAIYFPAVRAETRFILQWLERSNVLGVADVLVYPTNLLNELRPLCGGQPLGLFDPLNQLKPTARGLELDFLDLEETGLEKFHGKLAIVGPFASADDMPSYISKSTRTAATSGAGIVWIQPPSASSHPRPLLPSFYSLPVGSGNVVVVQPEVVADLSTHPLSQLNLVHFARLAVRPEPLTLPQIKLTQNANN